MSTLENLLTELCDRGCYLRHLSGNGARWEASITRPLPSQTPNGYVNAVGYGSGTTPNAALDEALDRVEHDFEVITTNLHFPPEREPVPQLDLRAILSNLRPPMANPFKGRL